MLPVPADFISQGRPTVLSRAWHINSYTKVAKLIKALELQYTMIQFLIECVHDGHVGGPKQYNDFPLENKFYFCANIFYCFSPSTWPPCTHSILRVVI